ncbi:MAG: AMP nucleosidase [Planctomycetota bacterium]|jgi:AMP nucleosidase
MGEESLAEGKGITRRKVALGALERYTGSAPKDFQPFILLTNFERYVKMFCELGGGCNFSEGSAMSVAHWPERKVSMIDTGVGSPSAALCIDMISYIKPRGVLMLGLCGGLRNEMKVGDYFNPVAAIRDEGTSNNYMPPQVPSLSSFQIQRRVTYILEKNGIPYFTGVIHTTNYRLWEFDESFRVRLKSERVQAIDMECATLFTAGFARKVPIGALMLISDLPLKKGGIKTKESGKKVFREHQEHHIELGIETLTAIRTSEVPVIYNW